MSFDELYLFNKSDNDGSGSGSPGKPIGIADESVGSVSGVGFGNFVPTGIESLGEVFQLVLFVPRGVKSKGDQLLGVDSKGGRLIGVESKVGQLIESFWHQKY